MLWSLKVNVMDEWSDSVLNNVVNLAEYREMREKSSKKVNEISRRSLSGPAKCLACKLEWMVECGTGDDVFDLVCPRCDTRRGQLIYPPEIEEKHVTWEHKCGNIHFTPVYLNSNGKMAGEDDLYDRHTLVFICHGCGDFISIAEFDE